MELTNDKGNDKTDSKSKSADGKFIQNFSNITKDEYVIKLTNELKETKFRLEKVVKELEQGLKHLNL